MVEYSEVNRNDVHVYVNHRGNFNIYDYVNDFEMYCPLEKVDDILEAMEHYIGNEKSAFRFLPQCINDTILDSSFENDSWSNNIQTNRIPIIIEMCKEFLSMNGIHKETKDEILKELNNYNVNKLLRVVRRIKERKENAND